LVERGPQHGGRSAQQQKRIKKERDLPRSPHASRAKDEENKIPQMKKKGIWRAGKTPGESRTTRKRVVGDQRQRGERGKKKDKNKIHDESGETRQGEAKGLKSGLQHEKKRTEQMSPSGTEGRSGRALGWKKPASTETTALGGGVKKKNVRDGGGGGGGGHLG